MTLRRTSRLFFLVFCFQQPLWFFGNQTDLKKIGENPLEKLQDLEVPHNASEKDYDQFLQVNSNHDDVNSKFYQWESIQLSFSDLAKEKHFLEDFCSKKPLRSIEIKSTWPLLRLDFEILDIMNGKFKEFLTKTNDLEMDKKLFIKSLDLINEEEEESYFKTVEDLFSFLLEEKNEFKWTMYLPLRKKYLAEFLNFLVHWSLIPSKLMEKIQSKTSSPSFLEWVSTAIFEGVNSGSDIDQNFQNYCILPHVEDYFENHFFLGYIKGLLNLLQKPQRNLVWIYVMKKSLIMKLADWPQSSDSKTYHEMDFFRKLVLSVFEITEIELGNQLVFFSQNRKNEHIPVGLIKSISKLASFLSDPNFNQNFFLVNSHENYSDIIIGSAHFMDYIHKIFFKELSRENQNFSSELLLTLNLLKAESTLKLWSSTLFGLMKTVGLDANYFQEKKNIYFKKIENHYKVDCQYLMNEIKNNPKNKILFQKNNFYKLENLFYLSKKYKREQDGSYKLIL